MSSKRNHADARDPRIIWPNSKERIEKAFELNGTQYYEFYDFNNVPCERAMWSFVYFNEMSMRCTREYLKAHCEATRAAFQIGGAKRNVDLSQLLTLNTQLEERLNMLFEPESAYRLCSVVYFDASENPYAYDQKYNMEKVTKFREAPLEGFFLSRPIGKLIPYLEKLGADLPTYFVTMQKVNLAHLENIFTMLSAASTKSDWYNSLASQKQGVSASLKSNT